MANFYKSYPPPTYTAAANQLLHPQPDPPDPLTPYGTTTVAKTPPKSARKIVILPKKPNNYRTYSIFVLLCSCCLCGLIALIYSCKVDQAYRRGDIAAAHKASNQARKWNFAGVVCGVMDFVVMVCIWLAISYGVWRIRQ